MSEEKPDSNSQSHDISFWITLIRGVLVIALGVSLIVIPEKTEAMLFNFMGVFWLTSGIVSVRPETRRRGSRLLLAAAIIGVLTGVLVIMRDRTLQWLPIDVVKSLLGAVIFLTGALHIATGFRIDRRRWRKHTVVSTLLGVIECVLGALLLLTPTGQEPVVFLFATVWSLLGGTLLLGTALYNWNQVRREERLREPPEAQK